MFVQNPVFSLCFLFVPIHVYHTFSLTIWMGNCLKMNLRISVQWMCWLSVASSDSPSPQWMMINALSQMAGSGWRWRCYRQKHENKCEWSTTKCGVHACMPVLLCSFLSHYSPFSIHPVKKKKPNKKEEEKKRETIPPPQKHKRRKTKQTTPTHLKCYLYTVSVNKLIQKVATSTFCYHKNHPEIKKTPLNKPKESRKKNPKNNWPRSVLGSFHQHFVYDFMHTFTVVGRSRLKPTGKTYHHQHKHELKGKWTKRSITGPTLLIGMEKDTQQFFIWFLILFIKIQYLQAAKMQL